MIEDLTDQLCGSAWTLFQEIESAGGAAAALEQGLIQKKVAPVRAARQAALARRTDMLTGTSDFADLDEPAVAVLDVAPLAAAPAPAGVTLEPLRRIRLAEPFEQLRDASDRMLAQTGARPKIFLANLGVPADFTPRANFARNFFAAGGIAAVSNDGFASRRRRQDRSRRPGRGFQEHRCAGSSACAARTKPMGARPSRPPRP